MGADCSKFIKQKAKVKDINEPIHDYSPFQKLPYVVKREIFSNLDTNSLLSLRLVSKDTKFVADSILKWRKDRQSLNRYMDNKSKTVALMNVFNGSDLVEFLDRPKNRRFAGIRARTSLTQLFQLCKHNLHNVTYIYIRDKSCSPSHCHYIVKCFPSLQYISFYNIRLGDRSVSHILRSLPGLKGLHFENLPIKGTCLADLGRLVHIIQLEKMDVCVAKSLPEATNIDSFTVHTKENIDAENILTVANKMPKLKHLFISCKELCSFEALNEIASPQLTSLKINVEMISGLNATIKYENVRKLEIHVCDTFTLFEMLLKVPNLKNLRINFQYCLDLSTTEVATAVASLRSLNTMTLCGTFYSHRQLVCVVHSVVKNGLINLLTSADFIRNVKLNMKFIIASKEDRKFFENTIEAIKELRAEKILVQHYEIDLKVAGHQFTTNVNV